ncbi:sensor histidine kinase [Rhodococcus sp. HNM0563]|uniref:sensor histidine kinase n=1 Tax=Rhodococcus sp. HNM0563 TaxID=2716339 RepID=UPI00146D5B67|nr:sensor histidine kinase [Rhodococcus sp. HNM0563]NLU62092.1 sensor histidine kinase [Rhodococcus sp. HNM0563]
MDPVESTVRRELIIDATLAITVWMIISVAIAADLGDDSTGPSLLAYLFAASFAGPVLFRRRRPVEALVLTAVMFVTYYALSFPPIGLALPLAIPLYSAAERGHLRWATVIAGALVLLSTVVRVGQGDELRYLLGFELAGSTGLLAAVIALGDSVRSRRTLREEMERGERAAELEREREATRRVEDERLLIARDLHDLLAHTITVIALHTDVAIETMKDDPPLARRSLTSVREACTRTVTELHATVVALRSPAGTPSEGDRAPTAGLGDLQRLVDTVSEAGVAVRIEIHGTAVPVPAVVGATAYRIVQEALSNVLRHADATEAVVAVNYSNDVVQVSIHDNGRGVSGSATEGWGLAGMRERAGLLGGSVEAHPVEGGGFVVDARIPHGGHP